ncbi:Protein pygopus [Nymphon striatum]|nr:Protein pygopus [Nymphon striatum]
MTGFSDKESTVLECQKKEGIDGRRSCGDGVGGGFRHRPSEQGGKEHDPPSMNIIYPSFCLAFVDYKKVFDSVGDPDCMPGGQGGLPASPTNAKRKNRKSNAAAQQNPSMPELIPPPLSSYGDTVVASNPFDDTPPMSMYTTPMQMNHNMPPMPPMPGVPPQMYPGAPMHCKPVPVSTGKIYPSDQPMVFNPQNPSAPPIYPCGVCHKEVHENEHALICESGCNFWFHRVCIGMTEAAFYMIQNEIYAEWEGSLQCVSINGCDRPSIKDLPSSISDPQHEINPLQTLLLASQWFVNNEFHSVA